MNRDEFRRSIFDIILYFTKHELSHTAKELILYYFNQSSSGTSYLRAIESIQKYTQEEIPPPEEADLQLTSLLEELSHQANLWDIEE